MARMAFMRKGDVLGTFRKVAQRISTPDAKDMPLRSVVNPSREEPYASITLVRICGGFGSKKARFYPDIVPTANNNHFMRRAQSSFWPSAKARRLYPACHVVSSVTLANTVHFTKPHTLVGCNKLAQMKL
jgi:hypothetical protein